MNFLQELDRVFFSFNNHLDSCVSINRFLSSPLAVLN